MHQSNQRTKVLIGLTFFLLVLLAMHFTGILNLFSLANLKSHRELLVSFVEQHYFLAVLIYMLVTILIVATALPLAAFIMILAGLLFGVKLGVVYVNIASTIGACISFIWLRYAFRQAVPQQLKTRLASFSQNIEQYGSLYFLSMHLMSLLPFFLINSLAVIAHISLFTFAWTTSLGIIPVSILYVYVGQRLCEITAVNQILTTPIICAFIALALVALLPVVFAKIKKFRS